MCVLCVHHALTAVPLGFAEQTGSRLALRSAVVAMLEAFAAKRHTRAAKLAPPVQVDEHTAVDGRDAVGGGPRRVAATP